jgi:hypothetical protein
MISWTSNYALWAMKHFARQVDECSIAARKFAEVTDNFRKCLPLFLMTLCGQGYSSRRRTPAGVFDLVDRRWKSVSPRSLLFSSPFSPTAIRTRSGNKCIAMIILARVRDEWERVRHSYGRFVEKNSVYNAT